MVVSAVTMVVQCDRKLADTSIQEACQARSRVNDSFTLYLMNNSIGLAKKDFNMSEESLRTNNIAGSIKYYGLAWTEAYTAIAMADYKVDPTVVISTPASPYMNTLQATLSGSVDDVAVYSIGNVTVNVNGKTMKTPLVNGKFSQVVDLKEGNNTIKVTATDLLFNKGSATIKTVVDTKKPLITINGVADSAYYNHSVTPLVTVSDQYLQSSTVTLNNLPYTSGTPVDSDGLYTLNVAASDLAGNQATSAVSFTVDKTAPVVSIIGVQPGSYLGRQVLIDGLITDENPGIISLQVDGVEVSKTLPYSWDTLRYPDGNHTVTLYAVDKAGNIGSSTLVAITDNTLPTVKFIVPKNGSVFSSGPIGFIWSGSDNYGIAFYELLFGDKTYRTTSTGQTVDGMADGNYQATINAVDLANNTGNASISLIIDTIPPCINITGIVEGGQYNYNLTPIINVTDANPNTTQALLNNVLYNGEPISEEGNYGLTVQADDLAGNVAAAQVNFTVDKTPPALQVNELTRNPNPLNLTYYLNGTVEPGALVTVNYESVDQDGAFEYAVNLSIGTNLINVSATDAAGNMAIWLRTRLIDNDTLPDYYELNVTHTDPLLGDTDGDNRTDDIEDPDEDGLINCMELLIGSDPLKADTDGDGLPDLFEFEKSFTSPLSPDSDSNLTSDADEDPDADGLINLMEYQSCTQPFEADSDGDGLNDGVEVNLYHTNPLSRDTDNDGFEDGSEVKFNTQPMNPDSDGDGIRDGNETYISTVSAANLSMTLSVQGIGDMSGKLGMSEAQDVNLANVSSAISKVVTIEGNDNFTDATLNYQYDPSTVTGTDNLAVGYYNESLGLFTPVDTTVNTVDHTVSSSVEQYGTYGVFDAAKLREAYVSAGDYNNQYAIPLDDAVVYTPETFDVTTISQVNGAIVTSSKAESLIPAFEWLPNFAYKQVHYVQGSNDGPLAGYQVYLQVYTDTGTSSGNKVYLNNHLQQQDYSDLRFTDGNGGVLHYWIEDVYPDHANVWVKVPAIPAGSGNSAPLYVFYGNSTIGSASDGNTTFRFFDDFSGPALDSSKWAASNGASIERNMLKLNGSSESGYWAASTQKFSTPYILEWRGKTNVESSNMQLGIGIGASTQGYIGGPSSGYLANNFDTNNGNLGFSAARYSNGGWSTLWNQNFQHYTDTLYRGKIIVTTTGIENRLYDDEGNPLAAGSSTDTTWQEGYIVPQVYGAGSDSSYDYLFVRNYTPHEPTHGTWAGETARPARTIKSTSTATKSMSMSSAGTDDITPATADDASESMISGGVIANRSLSDMKMADTVSYNESRPYDSRYLGDSFTSKIQLGQQYVAALQIANTGNTSWSMNNSSGYPVVELKPYNYDATILGNITASPANTGRPGSVNVFFVNLTPAKGNMYYCPMYVLYADGKPFGEIISTAVYVEDTSAQNKPALKTTSKSTATVRSAPGGFNSRYISNTMPGYSERKTDPNYDDVTATFENRGSRNWVAIADSSGMDNPNYNYVMIKPLNYDPNYRGNLPPYGGGNIAPNSRYAFPFRMLYANPGTYSTTFQLYIFSDAFGETFTKSYTVEGPVSTPTPTPTPTNNLDGWLYTYNLPSQLKTGESYQGSITMYNSGNIAWSDSNGVRLGASGFSQSGYPVSGSVSPGSTKTWVFNLVAPSAPGTYELRYRMIQNGQEFGSELRQTVTVTSQTPAFNAQYVTDTIPGTIYAGQSVNAKIVLKNTGSTAWTDSNVVLTDINGQAGLFSFSQKKLGNGISVKNGEVWSLSFSMTAPTTPGTTTISYQLINNGQEFGDVVSKQITVLPRSSDEVIDTDGDGLTDLQEYLGVKDLQGNVHQTDIELSDTDDDMLTDRREIGTSVIVNGRVFYNMISYPESGKDDSDNDGLSDGEEVLGTNTVYVADTRDSALNYQKANDDDDDNTDPSVSLNARQAFSHPLKSDTDGDKLGDGDEIAAGTNPGLYDSDKDGIIDSVELQYTDEGYDPTIFDVSPPVARMVTIHPAIRKDAVTTEYDFYYSVTDLGGVKDVKLCKNGVQRDSYTDGSRLPVVYRHVYFTTDWESFLDALRTVTVDVEAEDWNGNSGSSTIWSQYSAFSQMAASMGQDSIWTLPVARTCGFFSGSMEAVAEYPEMAQLMLSDPKGYVDSMVEPIQMLASDPGLVGVMITSLPDTIKQHQKMVNPYTEGSAHYYMFMESWYEGYLTTQFVFACTGAAALKAVTSTAQFAKVAKTAVSHIDDAMTMLKASKKIPSFRTFATATKASYHGLENSYEIMGRLNGAQQARLLTSLKKVDSSKLEALTGHHKELSRFLLDRGDDGAKFINNFDKDTLKSIFDLNPKGVNVDDLTDFRASLVDMDKYYNGKPEVVKEFVNNLDKVKDEPGAFTLQPGDPETFMSRAIGANSRDNWESLRMEAKWAADYKDKGVLKSISPNDGRSDFKIQGITDDEYIELKTPEDTLTADKVTYYVGNAQKKFVDQKNLGQIKSNEKATLVIDAREKPLGDNCNNIKYRIEKQVISWKDESKIDEIIILVDDGSSSSGYGKLIGKIDASTKSISWEYIT